MVAYGANGEATLAVAQAKAFEAIRKIQLTLSNMDSHLQKVEEANKDFASA
jgi:hypothetical protein